jgi:hypothetical protein
MSHELLHQLAIIRRARLSGLRRDLAKRNEEVAAAAAAANRHRITLAAAGQAVQETVDDARARIRKTPITSWTLTEARVATDQAFDNLRTKVVKAGQLQQNHQLRDSQRQQAAKALARAERKCEALEETASRRRSAEVTRHMERAAGEPARPATGNAPSSRQGGSCCS